MDRYLCRGKYKRFSDAKRRDIRCGFYYSISSYVYPDGSHPFNLGFNTFDVSDLKSMFSLGGLNK